jgi:hypothetical protein
MDAVCVDIVSRVVTPRATRAGTACGSSQKLTLIEKNYSLIHSNPEISFFSSF